MTTRIPRHTSWKIIALGCLLAALLYGFHPEVGQFTLLINGQPITNPVFRLAAGPALFVTLLFVAGLSALALLGMGMMIFLGFVGLVFLALIFIAPYFGPVLLLFCLIIAILSAGGTKE
ncbi:immunoglobulin domain-containing family protein [Methylomonas rapida]|jgi:hypothetical protein|uniref:DUF4064 domain-containing protein n=1 Tax=Methylomonas rapida TaxID=2963939 RepID=A0ABY7GGI0_9GAMM|nr:hypothetical protein [Methylomonas rapida]WAR44349.1 hypothetical protein NM686_018625 [Methylomonas rapida]